MGHAYDYAIGDAHGGTNHDVVDYRPSHRPGFTTLLNTDRNQYTPFNWSMYSAQSKVNYICSIFGTAAPNALELDLGATPGAVCSNPSVANGSYGRMFPKDIAIQKGPYFLNGVEEAFAELFVIEFLGNNQSLILPLVDRFLAIGVSPVRTMNCLRRTVNAWIFTVARPTNAVLLSPGAGNPSSCPQVERNL